MAGVPHRVSALDPPLGRHDAAAAALLLGLVAVMFWPLATLRAVPVPNDLFTNDLHYAHVPFRVLMAESLRAGHLPFWTPLVYAGYPLLADSATGTFFPLNWLFIWLPWPAALNLQLVLTFWLAALFTYLYGRTLGLARGGCLVAGIGFSLSGFFIGHVRHPNLINAALWLPAMLALVEAALAAGRRTWWLALAPVLALQVFAGGPPVVYVTLLGLAAYLALRLTAFRHGGAFSARGAAADAGWAIASLALGAALAAVQVLPTVELMQVSERASGLTREAAEVGALPLRDLLIFLYPYWNGDPGRGTYEGAVFWENCGYVGLLPLAAGLAAIALLLRRNRIVPLLAIAAALGVLAALGPHTPLFGFARKVLPGFAALRFPQRFLLWAILSLCMLAAVGLTAFTARLRGGTRRAAVAAMVGVTFLDLWHLQSRQVPVVPVGQWARPPESVAALAQDPQQPTRIYTLGAAESFVTAYHQANGWEGDLSPYVRQRALLQPNSNALYGFGSPAGYADLTPAFAARVWGSSLQKGLARRLMERGMGPRITVQPALQRLLDGWRVGRVLSPVPLRADGLWEESRAGWALVYQNPTALARVRIVPQARVVADDEALRLMEGGRWEPATTVLLAPSGAANRAAASGGGGTAQIVEETATRLTVRTETSGAAWLVLADTWYPGWRVEMDGTPTLAYRANLCQRGVRVDAGTHTVTFRYQATAYRRGLVVSLVALGVWLAALGVVLRRRRASP